MTSKEPTPKISVIVPCYNVENSVERCLNSIKNQSFKNFEALVVDDGSSDNTSKLIKNYIKRDQKFKYYYKKNGGLSSARNYGIEKAKGKFLCFIDSDDYIEKKYLESLYMSVTENNSDIAICAFNRVYPKTTNFNPVDNSFPELIKYPAAWNKLYRAELFKNTNIRFPEGMWYEDLGTLPKLLMLDSKISVVNRPLYNYIINNKSITHTYDDRIYQIYDIVEDLEKFASNHKLQTKYSSKLEFIYIYHILAGTAYRISFMDNFSPNVLKDIVDYVEKKYPNWSKNRYIKTLPIHFKLFLFLLHTHQYRLTHLLVKSLNRTVIL